MMDDLISPTSGTFSPVSTSSIDLVGRMGERKSSLLRSVDSGTLDSF